MSARSLPARFSALATLSRTAVVLGVVLVVALAAAAPRAAAGVVVVALDGSGDTDSLTNALNLVGPGDVILLREGSYVGVGPLDPEAFHYVNVPVTIVGDGAGATVGMLRIFDIPAGEQVVLRNLTISTSFLAGLFLEKLGVRDCAGAVLVEDCTITGLAGHSSHVEGFPAVDVRNSAGVSFTRCTLRGGAGFASLSSFPFGNANGPGGPGVLMEHSKVALHHCTVIGGAGGIDQADEIHSQPGGDALTIGTQSTVFAAGGSITGGKGSDGGSPALPLEAAGGDGIVQSGVFSMLRLVGVEPAGGAGGVLSDASAGPAGQALVGPAPSATLETYPQQARGTSMPATLRLGEVATLAISGAEGELAKVMVGFDLLHAQLGGKKGVLNLGGAVLGPILLGTVPASGVLELTVSFPTGTLLGLEGLRIDFQGLTFGAEGLMFGNPSSTLVLDESL